MTTRIVTKEMDDAAERLANRLEPVLLDAYMRVESLSLTWDAGQWETFLYTLTEKLPKRVTKLPLKKEEKLELLGAIDVLDRSIRGRGSQQTANMIIKSLITILDMASTARRFLKVKVRDADGSDITDEIFI